MGRWLQVDDAGTDATSDAASDSVTAEDSTSAQDAGTGDESGNDAGEEDSGGTHTGRGTVSGDVFAMEPEDFSPFWTDEPFLSKPARVFFMEQGETHEGQYVPGQGFNITDIPVGIDAHVMVEDIAGGNGIMATTMAARVKEGSISYAVPTLRRSHLEAIYASVIPPITLDGSKAHVLVTLVSCSLEGNVPMPGATFASISDGHVIYKNGAVWTSVGPTGESGLAMIANEVAGPAPGDMALIRYELGGETLEYPVRLIGGFVTRMVIAHPC